MHLSNQDTNGITRRSFMKKTALTAGAVTILSQGISLADTDSNPPERTIWVKYKTKKAQTVSGAGTDKKKAKNSFYYDASSSGQNITGTGNATNTGESHSGDVTGMTEQNPPLITSENGVEAAPEPVFSNGLWRCQRTIPKDTIILKVFYK